MLKDAERLQQWIEKFEMVTGMPLFWTWPKTILGWFFLYNLVLRMRFQKAHPWFPRQLIRFVPLVYLHERFGMKTD